MKGGVASVIVGPSNPTKVGFMASTAGENQRTPRVFISYSHDSAEHCDRVLMLAQQLRRDGIYGELDQFHQDELLHWPRWREERLRPENSEWVLCICTPEYKHRVEGRVAADVGKGVFWEGTLIYNYLYDDKGNRRCIPVFLDGNPGSDIPAILNGYTRFQISAFSLDDPQSGYAKLYRLLTGQSTAQKAGLGELHKLQALSSRERVTDFTDLINQILASRGVSQLLEDSAVVADGIRTTIAEKTTIPRRELSGELCRLIEASPLVFVTGAAGSGKSALVKSAFTAATRGGVGFAFRAVSLAGHHINDVLRHFGLSLAAFQAQTAMHGKKVLWVDGLERLMEKPAEQRAAFLDLLRALKLDPAWRLVVTCRDYSVETVRTAFFSEVGLTPADIDVGELSDDELNDVAADFPPLERPLANPSLRRLLRNPFFLDKAAKMNWIVTEPLPTNERAFREKVWSEVVRRVDEDVESGLPNLRGHAWWKSRCDGRKHWNRSSLLPISIRAPYLGWFATVCCKLRPPAAISMLRHTMFLRIGR